MSVRDCRLKMPLPVLWQHQGWPGEAPVLGRREQMVCAPYRAERTPSMSVKMEGDFYLWYDHGQGSGGDEVGMIMLMRNCDKAEAIRLYHEIAGVEEVKPERPAKDGPPRKIVAIYDYKDAEGRLVHQTVRFEPKSFAQRRPGAKGMSQGGKESKCDRRTGEWWLWTLAGIEPVLYHLPALMARTGDEVWLTEGEKDADVLAACGLLSTTCPMGAGKWRDSYTQTLAGRRIVVCVDSDAAGSAHSKLVRAKLRESGCKVDVVRWELVEQAGGGKMDAAALLSAFPETKSAVRDRVYLGADA